MLRFTHITRFPNRYKPNIYQIHEYYDYISNIHAKYNQLMDVETRLILPKSADQIWKLINPYRLYINFTKSDCVEMEYASLYRELLSSDNSINYTKMNAISDLYMRNKLMVFPHNTYCWFKYLFSLDRSLVINTFFCESTLNNTLVFNHPDFHSALIWQLFVSNNLYLSQKIRKYYSHSLYVSKYFFDELVRTIIRICAIKIFIRFIFRL